MLKSGKDIFEGGVQFSAAETTNGDRDLAARLTRKNMKSLPYWQKDPCTELNGPEATDQEFAVAMTKL